MGSSSSSTVNINSDTTIINKNTVDILDETLNKQVSNVIMKQASDCSANVFSNQTVSLASTRVRGSVNIGSIDQDQTSNIVLTCIQTNTMNNEIANTLSSEYVNKAVNNMSTEAIDKLAASANAAAQGQFGAIGAGSDSNSTVNMNYSFKAINDNRQNLRHAINNIIDNNFNSESLSSCITKNVSDQTLDLSSMDVGGDINIKSVNQKQATTVVSNCVQENHVTNNITAAILAASGVTVDNTNSVKKQSTLSASAESTAESVGVFQSAGQGISTAAQGIGKGIGSIVGSLFGGQLASQVSSSICCCVVIMVVLGGGFYMMSQGGDEEGDIPADMFE